MGESRRRLVFSVLFAALVVALGLTSVSVPVWGGEAEELLDAGNAFVEKKQYKAAIARYKEALRFKPNDADIHLRLGNAYLLNQNNVAAISALKEAVRLKSDNE